MRLQSTTPLLALGYRCRIRDERDINVYYDHNESNAIAREI